MKDLTEAEITTDQWADAYLKGKKLNDIEINETRFPLRITTEEWEENFNTGVKDWGIATRYHYDLFMLTAYIDPWSEQDVYEAICPNGRPRSVIFGPHKTPGLAKKKALAYLV